MELIVILCICFLTLWFFHREHSSPGCGCSVHTMAASLNERLSFQLQDLISRYSTVASCEGGESVVYQMVAQLVFEREEALRNGDQDPTLIGYANSVTQHNNQQGAKVSALYTVRARILFDILVDLLAGLKQLRIGMSKETNGNPKFNRVMFYGFVGRLLQPLLSGCVMLSLIHI